MYYYLRMYVRMQVTRASGNTFFLSFIVNMIIPLWRGLVSGLLIRFSFYKSVYISNPYTFSLFPVKIGSSLLLKNVRTGHLPHPFIRRTL